MTQLRVKALLLRGQLTLTLNIDPSITVHINLCLQGEFLARFHLSVCVCLLRWSKSQHTILLPEVIMKQVADE